MMSRKPTEIKRTRPNRLSVAWPPFAQKLAAVLEKLEEDQFVILSVKASNRFVQFAAQGASGMRVETTSNSYLSKSEQLNEQQISALIDAGWHAPTGTPADSTPEDDPEGSTNFFVQFLAPVPFEAVANLTVRTITEIMRVPHLRLLQYEAFCEGEEAIALPELGLTFRKRAGGRTAKTSVRQKVTLRQECGKDGSRYLSASYTPDGDLIFEGQDLGAGVRAVFGFREYEWVWTVPASSLSALQKALGNPSDLLLALKKNFSNDDAEKLDAFLADHNIKYETWNRIGD